MNWSEAQIIECWEKNELWGSFQQSDLQAALCLLRSDLDYEILWIQTHPDLLKQGVARGLLSEWLCFASQHGRLVYLEVHEENHAAMRLYQKLGFEKRSVRRNYYSDGANAISFQLDLAKVKSPP
jgi:ribosomal-protein-alanine N-acetyltransferase